MTSKKLSILTLVSITQIYNTKKIGDAAMGSDYSIVLTAFPDKGSAKSAAKMLVERRLAACVQIFPVDSVYLWENEICDNGEIVLLIKSKTILFEKIAAAIREVHAYELPEIVQMPVTVGLSEYLQWIGAICE